MYKVFLIFSIFKFASICAQNSVKILANPYTWMLCQMHVQACCWSWYQTTKIYCKYLYCPCNLLLVSKDEKRCALWWISLSGPTQVNFFQQSTLACIVRKHVDFSYLTHDASWNVCIHFVWHLIIKEVNYLPAKYLFAHHLSITSYKKINILLSQPSLIGNPRWCLSWFGWHMKIFVWYQTLSPPITYHGGLV